MSLSSSGSCNFFPFEPQSQLQQLSDTAQGRKALNTMTGVRWAPSTCWLILLRLSRNVKLRITELSPLPLSVTSPHLSGVILLTCLCNTYLQSTDSWPGSALGSEDTKGRCILCLQEAYVLARGGGDQGKIKQACWTRSLHTAQLVQKKPQEYLS